MAILIDDSTEKQGLTFFQTVTSAGVKRKRGKSAGLQKKHSTKEANEKIRSLQTTMDWSEASKNSNDSVRVRLWVREGEKAGDREWEREEARRRRIRRRTSSQVFWSFFGFEDAKCFPNCDTCWTREQPRKQKVRVKKMSENLQVWSVFGYSSAPESQWEWKTTRGRASERVSEWVKGREKIELDWVRENKRESATVLIIKLFPKTTNRQESEEEEEGGGKKRKPRGFIIE